MDEAVESIEAMDKTFESKITVTGEVLKGEILSEKASVGDYVSMRPTSTSYTIEGSKTGCTDASYCNGVTDQTINPSELNLWRIIKKNEDGTIEMVSEYTSNEEVYFYGKEGYKNLVGTLNEIAASYENDTYTIGSRYMGYDGQTEVLTDESKFVYPAPWTTSTDTHGNQYESLGGGDILYQSDVDLVQNAIGSIGANRKATTELSNYWLASRQMEYDNKNYYLEARIINFSSNLNISTLYSYYNEINRLESLGPKATLRPIIILKSNIILSEGTGTSESPWVLN